MDIFLRTERHSLSLMRDICVPEDNVSKPNTLFFIMINTNRYMNHVFFTFRITSAKLIYIWQLFSTQLLAKIGIYVLILNIKFKEIRTSLSVSIDAGKSSIFLRLFLCLCLRASRLTFFFIISSNAITSLYDWKSTSSPNMPGDDPRSNGLAVSGLYGELPCGSAGSLSFDDEEAYWISMCNK